MPPVTKDSDTPTTAPENASRSGSAGASASDSGVKQQPVALEIPITVNGARTVEGSDKREPFSESTKTVMVFGSGAVIKLASNMAPGQLLFLTNERTKKEVVCQVVKSKNYRNVSGYVELEFTEPAVGFWGMRFPSDRIGPGPQAAPETTRPALAGNGSSAPAQPAAEKTEQPVAKSSPVAAKPPIAAPVAAKPAPSASKSSIAPPATPVATTLGSDEPLVEPWLKKRGPVSKVPAPQSSAVSPAPPAKPSEPEAILPTEPNFELARPSDKPASLFAPAEASSTLAKVDLSTLAPFFEVKPAAADEPAAGPPKAQASSAPETQELKQQTTRLQDELAKMQFAETTSSSKVKAQAEKPDAKKPVAPEMEVPSFPLTEESFATLKTELVHENAVRLVENPEPSDTAPVLPELSRLNEAVKVEPAAAIPALESLEQEEMKIPAWLEPLARSGSAPSSTKELVLREKAKRRAEQLTLEEMTAPLVAPAEKGHVAGSRVPQFGSALPFEETKRVKESSRKKSGKGMLFVGLAAGVLLVAGGWRYMNQQFTGVHANTAAVQAPADSTASQDLQTNSSKEAAPASMPTSSEEASPVKSGPTNSNAPNRPASAHASSVAASSSATAARNPQANSNSSNGGSVVPGGAAATQEPVAEAEKKPVLGEVHLAAPKISQKRTVQGGAAPDAAISSSEDQPEANADSLGASLGAESNQPTAPAGPVAVGGDVKQAKLITSVSPVYPALARAQHISGGVTIDALIDTNGRVTTMKVISGPTLLQQAAMDALRQWKYQPATLDGKAVPMHLSVTIQFRLQE